MSDKVKTKKIDLRLAENVFEEITLVSWLCGNKRSEILRMMINFFVAHGLICFDGQELAWEKILELAREKQATGEMTFTEICESMSGRTARQTEIDVSEELGDELQVFAEIYAKNAIEAFKKHTGGGNNG